MSTNAINGFQKDFNLLIGETWNWVTQIKDLAGNPIDLTNVDITGEIHTTFDVASPIVGTLAKGAEITIGGTGNAFITVSKVNNYPYKSKYYYFIKFDFRNGTIAKIYGIHNYPKPIPQ